MLRRWYQTLEFAVLRDRNEALLDGEIQYHIEQETRENMRRGMSLGDARRTAMLEFGGVCSVQEECREASLGRGAEWASDLYRDFRFALRGLRKNPGYTLAAVLTLALGIGSNTALFSVLRSVSLRPLPIRDGERVVWLQRIDQQTGQLALGYSYPEMQFYRAHTKTLEELAEYHTMGFTLLGRGEPRNVSAAVVGANYFDFFGLRALYGRTFLPGEDAHDAAPVLVLSHRFFMSGFGGDPAVIGTPVRLNDRPHIIAGVLPPLPEFPARVDVYMPTSSCPTRGSPHFQADHRSGLLRLYGRLKPGATLAEAQAEYETLEASYRGDRQGADLPTTVWAARAVPLSTELSRQARPVFTLLFAITGLVLLIACASVANLTLARALRRQREVAVRAALGASQARLLQQFLVEGVLVSLGGGVLGLLAAKPALELLTAFAARFSSRAYDIRLDSQVLILCLGPSVLAGVIACAFPAWRARANLVAASKDGSAGSTPGRVRQRGRRILVSVQVAISCAVLIAAGLVLTSFERLLAVDPGFQPQHVLALTVEPNWSHVQGREAFVQFFHTLLDRVRAAPGVTAAGVTARIPLEKNATLSRGLYIEGQTYEGAPAPMASFTAVSPGYFASLRVPVLRGRDFMTADGEHAQLVAIVNDTMARRRWPNADPVGRRMRLGDRLGPIDKGAWITVAGVVGDVHSRSLEQEPGEEVYLPFDQASAGTQLVVRISGEAAAAIRDIRRIVYRMDPDQAVTSARTLDEILTDNRAAPELTTRLLGLLAILTLVITLTGIGGVAAVACSLRRGEIGIRMALGGRPGRLIATLVREELPMVVSGLAAGLALALSSAGLLRGFLFGITPTDPFTFTCVAVLLLCAAILACVIPAVRATRVDPVQILRSE